MFLRTSDEHSTAASFLLCPLSSRRAGGEFMEIHREQFLSCPYPFIPCPYLVRFCIKRGSRLSGSEDSCRGILGYDAV